jgi:DNA-binding NarL/FixJ family response regulator
MCPIRVLVADDSFYMRLALRSLLEAETDIEVVGEASNGLEALEETRLLHPDVILMDLNMPIRDGLEATAAIKGEMAGTQVIVLTAEDSAKHRAEALRVGAAGLVGKHHLRDLIMEIRGLFKIKGAEERY